MAFELAFRLRQIGDTSPLKYIKWKKSFKKKNSESKLGASQEDSILKRSQITSL